jgi:hypothetical protein
MVLEEYGLACVCDGTMAVGGIRVYMLKQLGAADWLCRSKSANLDLAVDANIIDYLTK